MVPRLMRMTLWNPWLSNGTRLIRSIRAIRAHSPTGVVFLVHSWMHRLS